MIPRVAGIIIDGYNVVFINCTVDSDVVCKVDPEVGVHSLDADKLRKIIRVVIAAHRKKLDAKILASDFGHMSPIAKEAVRTLYKALVNAKSEKTKAMFEEWKKIHHTRIPSLARN